MNKVSSVIIRFDGEGLRSIEPRFFEDIPDHVLTEVIDYLPNFFNAVLLEREGRFSINRLLERVSEGA